MKKQCAPCLHCSLFFLSLFCLFSFSEAQLIWRNISNPEALCNDYTRAGYFIRRNTDSNKWLVFLESGGLCYSTETCNSRLLHPRIRDSNKQPRQAWNDSIGLPLKERINPFMTSLVTATGDPNVSGFYGQDLLDTDKEKNPIFYNYNHILIPYCSSDAWLANDTRPSVLNIASQKNFNFYDQAFNITNPPSSARLPKLQFIFRGAVIFRSVIEELLANESLVDATELVLAGSSAGGLGVVNHASWVEQQLNQSLTKISIITDSSWFINFRDNIFNRFNESSSNDEEDVLSLISSVPQCSNNDSTSPCCIRLHCMLNSPEYFPVGRIPVISLTSLHDLFILSDTIARTVLPGDTSNSDSVALPELGISFLNVISEYGGAMNTTLAAAAVIPGVSLIITECFQHIYFATSTLWDHNGILSDTAVVELSDGLGSFNASYNHNITSGTWSLYFFSGSSSTRSNLTLIQNSCNPSNALTIQDAITMWYHCRDTETMVFRDHCTTVHCNQQCPDEVDFAFDLSDPRDWIVNATTAVVASITVISITFKLIFFIWDSLLSLKQKLYIHRMDTEQELSHIHVHDETDGPKFPECSIEEAVSVACVDLRYSIDFHPKKVKNEKEDRTTISLVIDDDEPAIKDKPPLVKQSSSRLIRKPSDWSDWTARLIINKQRNMSSSAMSRKSVVVDPSKDHIDHDDDDDDDDDNETDNTNEKTARSKQAHPMLPRQPNEVSEETPPPSFSKKISNASSQDPLMSSIASRTLQRDFLPSMPPPPSIDETDTGDSPYHLLHSNPSIVSSMSQTTKPTPGLCGFGRVRKEILRGISLYFNPGELVGIMGPSGCGKTTFLDLLTGRRNKGNVAGHIYINGYPLERVRKKYIYSTGYVLQLATPYYEELTVRENLILSAHMRLPSKMTWREKFERVEQVMSVTGLTDFQNTLVGGSVGPGLSGGQKRRLVIALQLLTMPSVIFLDEPTSGLDATSSIELLSHLNGLAYSNRTVVLTIHQPRFEIFYMFHKLILLSDGKVAYHGVPQKAYSFFVEALMNKYLNRGLLMPQLEEHNPADIIMDMLGKPWMREVILEHYQTSSEPELIKWAIKRARVFDFESVSIATLSRDDSNDLAMMRHSSNPAHINPKKAKKIRPQASWFARLAVLEARASKRASLIWMLYLPVIFFVYGFVLGTTYLQQDAALFVLSGFCVYSVASALFMFPVLQNYYIKALEVYRYEKADGAGRAQDLVFQGFFRFSTMGIIPVVLSAGVLYLLSVKQDFWDGMVFLDIAIINMALNQTWIALLTFILCAFPNYSARLSPMISSVAGFSSGFFVPRDETGWYYRWIFYINPNYYGFSGIAKRLLSDFNNDCDNLDVNCYINSGNFILHRYGFSDINPFIQVAVLLLMTVIFVLLAVFANWLRHTTAKEKILIFLKPKKDLIGDDDDESYCTSDDYKGDPTLYHDAIDEEEEEEELVGVASDPGQANGDELGLDEQVEVTSDHDDVFESTGDPQSASKGVKFFNIVKSLSRKDIETGDDGNRIELKSMKSRSPSNSSSKLQSTSAAEVRRRHSNKRPRAINFNERRQRLRGPSCLLMEHQSHSVYQPKTPTTKNKVLGAEGSGGEEVPQEVTAPSPLTPAPAPRTSLKERQQDFDWHVKTTQEVVKERTEEIINNEQRSENVPRKLNLRDVTKRVTMRSKAERQPKLANVVADALAKLKEDGGSVSDKGEKEEDGDSGPPLSAPTTFTTASIANAWRDRAKKQNTQDARKSMVLVPVNRIPELKKRVSMSSLKPEPSPSGFGASPDDTKKSPKSILRKKNSSDKASPSPFQRFSGIKEDEDGEVKEEMDGGRRGSRGSRQLQVVPSYFFAGTENDDKRKSGISIGSSAGTPNEGRK